MATETYYVTVKSSPEINARVFINDADTGQKTPYVFELPKGVYTFKVVDETGNFNFLEWWKDNAFLDKIPEVTIEVNADMELEARFIPKPATAATEAYLPSILNLVLMLLFISVIMEVIRSAIRFRG